MTDLQVVDNVIHAPAGSFDVKSISPPTIQKCEWCDCSLDVRPTYTLTHFAFGEVNKTRHFCHWGCLLNWANS